MIFEFLQILFTLSFTVPESELTDMLHALISLNRKPFKPSFQPFEVFVHKRRQTRILSHFVRPYSRTEEVQHVALSLVIRPPCGSPLRLYLLQFLPCPCIRMQPEMWENLKFKSIKISPAQTSIKPAQYPPYIHSLHLTPIYPLYTVSYRALML